MNNEAELRHLEKSEALAAAGVMNRAFAKDPFTLHVFPHTKGRGRGPKMHMMDLNYGLNYGLVVTTPQVEGLSIWLPPQSSEIDITRMLRCGLVSSALRMGWRVFRRFNQTCAHLDNAHDELMKGPHWYLYILAVDPDRQSQGLGSKLISPGIDWAGEDGLPLFLETLNRRALKFYQSHGFEIIDHRRPSGSPEFWCLVRQPG